MHLVTAENVETDRAQRVAVEQEIDGAPERDSVQPHGKREQLCAGELLHTAAIVPGPPRSKPGLQKPSSPTAGRSDTAPSAGWPALLGSARSPAAAACRGDRRERPAGREARAARRAAVAAAVRRQPPRSR